MFTFTYVFEQIYFNYYPQNYDVTSISNLLINLYLLIQIIPKKIPSVNCIGVFPGYFGKNK